MAVIEHRYSAASTPTFHSDFYLLTLSQENQEDQIK